jgi:hypothetical protein
MPHQQIFYQRGMELAVKELIALFSNGSLSPQTLFFRCLEICGPTRAQIALDQNCEDKLLFGMRRKADSHFLCTKLNNGDSENGYEQCNQETILSIKASLPQFFQNNRWINKKKTSKNPLFSLNELSIGNKIIKSFFSYRLISEETITQVLDEITFFSHIYKETDKTEVFTHLRNLNQEMYNKIVLANVVLSIKNSLSCNKTKLGPILQITTYLESAFDKRKILSDYFTGINIDSSFFSAKEQHMQPIHFVHQAPFLIDETLDLVAEIFAKAFVWKKKIGLQYLTIHIGLIRYLLTHIAPFKRGSAAISDWIETALYRYHGFSDFQPSRQTDLKAISLLRLDHFMDYYQQFNENKSTRNDTLSF